MGAEILDPFRWFSRRRTDDRISGNLNPRATTFSPGSDPTSQLTGIVGPTTARPTLDADTSPNGSREPARQRGRTVADDWNAMIADLQLYIIPELRVVFYIKGADSNNGRPQISRDGRILFKVREALFSLASKEKSEIKPDETPQENVRAAARAAALILLKAVIQLATKNIVSIQNNHPPNSTLSEVITGTPIPEGSERFPLTEVEILGRIRNPDATTIQIYSLRHELCMCSLVLRSILRWSAAASPEFLTEINAGFKAARAEQNLPVDGSSGIGTAMNRLLTIELGLLLSLNPKSETEVHNFIQTVGYSGTKLEEHMTAVRVDAAARTSGRATRTSGTPQSVTGKEAAPNS